MSPDFSNRLRGLLSQRDSLGSDFRRVIMANFGASLGLGIATVIGLHLSFPWIALFAPPAFALLTVCVLYRFAFWIPAFLTGATIAALPAMGFSGVAALVLPGITWAWIPGAVIGFAIGFVIVFRIFSRVSAVARRSDHG